MKTGIILKKAKKALSSHTFTAVILALSLSFLSACATTHGVMSPAEIQKKYESN